VESARRVDERDHRKVEPARQEDQPDRLAIAFRLGHSEIVAKARSGVVAFLMADQNHPPAAYSREPADNSRILGIGPVAAPDNEVGIIEVILFLKVAVPDDGLKTGLLQQRSDVLLTDGAQRKEVNIAILISVPEFYQVLVGFVSRYVHRLANVVELVLAPVSLILDEVIIPVVYNSDAAGPQQFVEAITLRTTRLRDVNGVVWHVPNGQINRIGNFSQEWSRALLDISVAYDTNIEHASEVIKRVADGMWHDPRWGPVVLDEPEVWGVEDLGPNEILIRLVVKTAPTRQFEVSRELRQRLKAAFDAEGIVIPFPQRTVWMHHVEGPEPSGNGAPAKEATDGDRRERQRRGDRRSS
jgi:hypothetical protein